MTTRRAQFEIRKVITCTDCGEQTTVRGELDERRFKREHATCRTRPEGAA